MADDLWPDNIGDSKLITPVAILKEQAVLLGEKTKQLVVGEVSTGILGPMFVHSFCISAPTIKYRYELFTASHAINFYPLTVQFASQKTLLGNEDAFRAKLKSIFSDAHTLTVVHSILAQVRA